MPELRRVSINSDLDIVAARVEGRNLARTMGFGVIDQARIATAISELARNVVLYADAGQIILTPLEQDGKRGLRIVCEDRGPGIEDVDLVMRNGYSSMQGLGMGLPGTRRLMDEFEIKSRVGIGTTIVVCKWLPRGVGSYS
jgi:serine/threonine-protein kinase RsbT